MAQSQTLAEYLQGCKEKKTPAIPADHAVFDYAKRMGFDVGPDGMIDVAWWGFKQYYLYDDAGKKPGRENKQKNWPQHFFNSIKHEWAMSRCWYVTESLEVVWTSKGNHMKAQMLMERKASGGG